MDLVIPQKQLEAIYRSIVKKTEGFDRLIGKALQRCAARPGVVCLCGSTRFGEAYKEANLRHTLAGRIVLSIGCNMKSDTELFEKLFPAESERENIKEMLDELHLCKIDQADWIEVLNVGGYIGDSTEQEIAYAMYLGKRVEYLEN